MFSRGEVWKERRSHRDLDQRSSHGHRRSGDGSAVEVMTPVLSPRGENMASDSGRVGGRRVGPPRRVGRKGGGRGCCGPPDVRDPRVQTRFDSALVRGTPVETLGVNVTHAPRGPFRTLSNVHFSPVGQQDGSFLTADFYKDRRTSSTPTCSFVLQLNRSSIWQ